MNLYTGNPVIDFFVSFVYIGLSLLGMLIISTIVELITSHMKKVWKEEENQNEQDSRNK